AVPPGSEHGQGPHQHGDDRGQGELRGGPVPVERTTEGGQEHKGSIAEEQKPHDVGDDGGVESHYRKSFSTLDMALGRQQTTTLSPWAILKPPRAMIPSPLRMTPPMLASRGKSSSLIFLPLTREVGFTSNSRISVLRLFKRVRANTLPFLTCLKMLLAASSFLLIRVSTPMDWESWK